MERAIDRFSAHTYPNAVEVFGSEWQPGVDSDPRLHILYTSALGQGMAGYFYSADEYTVPANPFSNEKEMFYINLNALQNGGSQYYETVLAHELQHMIHWNHDRGEDLWINEGLSEYAQQVADFDADTTFIAAFAANPDLQLTTWGEEPGANGPHYGAAYSFVAYLVQRFGNPVLTALVAEPANGMAGVEAALAVQGQPLTAAAVFADWVVANYVQDAEALGQARVYGYEELKLPVFAPAASHDAYPVREQQKAVSNYGVDYIQLAGEGDLRVQFDGAQRTRLADASPPGDEHMWWSNRGDDANSRLTRRFDLSALAPGAPVTLTAAMWWAIEENYDYGYVMASHDGVKWEILPGQHTRTADPSGNNWGAGYTGHSINEPAAISGWVTETFDLSAYAAGPVWVQFNYVTDDAVNASGWFVDQIAVTSANSVTDSEVDVEETSGWQSEGWLYTDNWLPQILAGPGDGIRWGAFDGSQSHPSLSRSGRVHRGRAWKRTPRSARHQRPGAGHDAASHVQLYH